MHCFAVFWSIFLFYHDFSNCIPRKSTAQPQPVVEKMSNKAAMWGASLTMITVIAVMYFIGYRCLLWRSKDARELFLSEDQVINARHAKPAIKPTPKPATIASSATPDDTPTTVRER